MAFATEIPWFLGASRRKRWLVGVSGGADSVALLRILVAEGFTNLIICHLDHGLRGCASTEDAKFVMGLADALDLPCESAKVDVAKQMKAQSQSLETAARQARHEFFARCAQKHRCRRVLLAHHADDQAETVLWNLLRGSHGLKGMRCKKVIVTRSGAKLEVHRPLLQVRRTDLVSWLKLEGHQWREDASNAEPIAIRNRLRNEAIPLLNEISQRDLVLALTRGAEVQEETAELERWALEHAKVLDPQARLHVPSLRELPLGLQKAAVRQFLRDHGVGNPERDLIQRALDLLDLCKPASINLPSGKRLRRSGGRLWVDG